MTTKQLAMMLAALGLLLGGCDKKYTEREAAQPVPTEARKADIPAVPDQECSSVTRPWHT